MSFIITSQSKVKRKPYSSTLLLHKLKEKPLRLLSWLYYQSQYRSRLKATHGQIADWLNMSQSSVKRAFIALRDAGVCWWSMIKINPKYSAPNEYHLHEDLKTVGAQEMMEVFFKNFYKLPLFSLFFKPHSVGIMENDLPNISNKDKASISQRYDEAQFQAFAADEASRKSMAPEIAASSKCLHPTRGLTTGERPCSPLENITLKRDRQAFCDWSEFCAECQSELWQFL